MDRIVDQKMPALCLGGSIVDAAIRIEYRSILDDSEDSEVQE